MELMLPIIQIGGLLKQKMTLAISKSVPQNRAVNQQLKHLHNTMSSTPAFHTWLASVGLSEYWTQLGVKIGTWVGKDNVAEQGCEMAALFEEVLASKGKMLRVWYG